MCHSEHFGDHRALLTFTPTLHSGLETMREMLFHKLPMGRAEEPHDREILLHDIDAVRVSLEHTLDLGDEALRLAIGNPCFLMLLLV